MNLDDDGAERITGAALAVLPSLEAMLPSNAVQAGVRLHGEAALRQILSRQSEVGRVAAHVLGQNCRPVRAILFDKRLSQNWTLGWHQDRTIAVAKRCDVPGFGPWTVKQRMIHVEPPFEIIESMLTLRVHFDRVDMNNAPLRISPGSHRFGRIAEPDVARIVAQCGDQSCMAERGDVWLYRTPILHASNAAAVDSRRRVLQVDYAATELPGGLQWLGI